VSGPFREPGVLDRNKVGFYRMQNGIRAYEPKMHVGYAVNNRCVFDGNRIIRLIECRVRALVTPQAGDLAVFDSF
jgi:hypothetical protein